MAHLTDRRGVTRRIGGPETCLIMWLRYWNLDRDPFDDRLGPFVATQTHVEAQARLIHTVESVARSARLIAPGGLGKTTVLGQALDAIRSPSRRVARVHDPVDGPSLFAALARALGAKVGRDATRGTAWMALTEACRLCRWQNLHVVMAIDGVQTLESPADRRDLDRLDHLDPESRLTVLRVGRPTVADEDSPQDWSLVARLTALTRSEAARYVSEKLHQAGKNEPTFTPRALTRLHALSEGVPRAVDRLARLAMMAGSVRGLEMVNPDVVDEASRECLNYADSASL